MHGFNEIGKAVALTRLLSHRLHLTSVYKLELRKRLTILQLHQQITPLNYLMAKSSRENSLRLPTATAGLSSRSSS